MGGKATIDLTDDNDSTDEELIIDEIEPAATSQDEDIVDEDLDPLDRLPKGARKNADGTVTLTLNFPVTMKTKKAGQVKERHYDTLTFHRLTGAHLRAIQAASPENQVVVSLAQSLRFNQAIMNALFDRMTDVDCMNAGQVVNHFFASGRTTGARASAS